MSQSDKSAERWAAILRKRQEVGGVPMTHFDKNAERWAAILRNSPYVLRQHEREIIADMLDSYRRATRRAEREIASLKRQKEDLSND